MLRIYIQLVRSGKMFVLSTYLLLSRDFDRKNENTIISHEISSSSVRIRCLFETSAEKLGKFIQCVFVVGIGRSTLNVTLTSLHFSLERLFAENIVSV